MKEGGGRDVWWVALEQGVRTLPGGRDEPSRRRSRLHIFQLVVLCRSDRRRHLQHFQPIGAISAGEIAPTG
jgi:hypothetical protein